MKARFDCLLANLRTEMSESALLKKHRTTLAGILAKDDFKQWRTNVLTSQIDSRLSSLNGFIRELCQTTGESPFNVSISFPAKPSINLPEGPAETNGTNGNGAVGAGAVAGAAIGTAILPGLGTVVGAIVGGLWGNSAKEAAQEKARRQRALARAEHENQVQAACEKATQKYLKALATNIKSKLDDTEVVCHQLLIFKNSSPTKEENKLNQLAMTLGQSIDEARITN